MALLDFGTPDHSRRARRGRPQGMANEQFERVFPDHCTKDGAKALADRIAEYWRDRGHEVVMMSREAGFLATMRSARHDVRSNMINGMPRSLATAALPSRDAA